MTWFWCRKRNLRRETEFISIAAEKNATENNYAKARRDKASGE